MSDNPVTPYDVIVMWTATTLLKKNMGQKATVADFANDLLRELDDHGFVVAPKDIGKK
jgi:hypothetical protein